MSYYFSVSGNCSRYFPHSFDLTRESNTGELGAYVYRIDGSEIFDPGSKGPQHYYNYCIWSVYYIINIL